MQNRKMAKLALIALCMGGTQHAWGQSSSDPFKLEYLKNSKFALRAEPGLTYYGVDLGGRNEFVGISSNGTYVDVALGATMFIANQFALDGYVRLPVTKPSSGDVSGTAGATKLDSTIDRTEYNITGYYRLESRPNMGLFLGWRGDDTKATARLPGVLAGTFDNHKFHIETRGPTLGMQYGWVGDNNHMSVVGGIAYQQGTVKLDSTWLATGENFNGSKSAIGYVFGLKGGKILSPQWDMFYSADLYQIDFGRITLSSTRSLPMEQWSASIRVGARYAF